MAITHTTMELSHATAAQDIADFLNDEVNPLTITYEGSQISQLIFTEADDTRRIQYIELYSDREGKRGFYYTSSSGTYYAEVPKTGEYYSVNMLHLPGTPIIFLPSSVDGLTENITKVVIGYSGGSREVAYMEPVDPPTPEEVTIEPFVLPRLDWFDEDGRIYKDALIENFNALEAKFNEIANISAFSADIPDISDLHLEEVDLDDDDNKVVSLKSFIDIFDLINYPIELTFNDTKISKISYWNSDYNYITRKNIETNATSTNRYVFYNFSNNTARSSSTVDIGENETLIACYINNRMITITSAYAARLNLMYLLSHMATNTQDFYVGTGASGENFYFREDATGKQQAGIRHSESQAGKYSRNMTFYQLGRKEK